MKTACERFSSKGKEGEVIKISVKAHIRHTLKVVVRMVAVPFALAELRQSVHSSLAESNFMLGNIQESGESARTRECHSASKEEKKMADLSKEGGFECHRFVVIKVFQERPGIKPLHSHFHIGNVVSELDPSSPF